MLQWAVHGSSLPLGSGLPCESHTFHGRRWQVSLQVHRWSWTKAGSRCPVLVYWAVCRMSQPHHWSGLVWCELVSDLLLQWRKSCCCHVDSWSGEICHSLNGMTMWGFRRHQIHLASLTKALKLTSFGAELVWWLMLLPVASWSLDSSCFTGATNCFGAAAAALGVALWWLILFDGCTRSDAPLEDSSDACPSPGFVWASLRALLSKAFLLFSSIFRCCSAVSWLDIMKSSFA